MLDAGEVFTGIVYSLQGTTLQKDVKNGENPEKSNKNWRVRNKDRRNEGKEGKEEGKNYIFPSVQV